MRGDRKETTGSLSKKKGNLVNRGKEKCDRTGRKRKKKRL